MYEHPPTLQVIDKQLCPLQDALERAVTRQQPVIVHEMWHHNWAWPLLPFHLQLRWPGSVDALPLTPTFALLPFRHADACLLETPLYTPDEAKHARLQARAFRHELSTDLKNDFVHGDWEEGFERHREELSGKLLPAASYLAIDVVTDNGVLSPGTRPCLGRLPAGMGSVHMCLSLAVVSSLTKHIEFSPVPMCCS